VKTSVIALAALASLSAVASAQDLGSLDERIALTVGRTWGTPLGEEASADLEIRPEVAESELPRSLSASLEPVGPVPIPFSLGVVSGYLRAHNTDQGTWFLGVQARMHFGMFAAEASIQYHRDQYQGGGVVVYQYPVQLSAFLYPIPEGPVRPYILGGVGWYYSDVDYRGALSLTNSDRTDNIFGEHLGAGVDLYLGPTVSVDADLRYIFLNPTTDQVIGRAFNYWQVNIGLNIFF
jgi:opacity protein-like surface antigen